MFLRASRNAIACPLHGRRASRVAGRGGGEKSERGRRSSQSSVRGTCAPRLDPRRGNVCPAYGTRGERVPHRPGPRASDGPASRAQGVSGRWSSGVGGARPGPRARSTGRAATWPQMTSAVDTCGARLEGHDPSHAEPRGATRSHYGITPLRPDAGQIQRAPTATGPHEWPHAPHAPHPTTHPNSLLLCPKAPTVPR